MELHGAEAHAAEAHAAEVLHVVADARSRDLPEEARDAPAAADHSDSLNRRTEGDSCGMAVGVSRNLVVGSHVAGAVAAAVVPRKNRSPAAEGMTWPSNYGSFAACRPFCEKLPWNAAAGPALPLG